MSRVKCVGCGDSFKKIGNHWSYNPDHRPTLSERELAIARGALMGDGTLVRNSKHAALRVWNTNTEFLEWIGSELEAVSYGVTKVEDPGPTEVMGVETMQKAQFRVQTVCHPDFEDFRSWYSTGVKQFPTDTISPMATKVWYCCDGSARTRNLVMISATNESANPEKLANLVPVEVTKVENGFVYFDRHQFLDYIGDPVPGMEYKWQ